MVLIGALLEMDAEGPAPEQDIDRPATFPDKAGPIANGPLAVISVACRGIPRPLPFPFPSSGFSALRDDGADSYQRLLNQNKETIG